MLKIAYLKNGNVAIEAKTLSPYIDKIILRNGGPLHYIASFLNWSSGKDRLLISIECHKRYKDNQQHVAAVVYNAIRTRKIYARVFWECVMFFRILAKLLIYKPNWVLCAIAGGGPLAASFLAAKILKVPYIHSRHMRVSLYKPSFIKRFKFAVDSFIIRKANNVLCNGKYLEDQLLNIGVNKNKLIQFCAPYKDIQDFDKSTEIQNAFCKFSNKKSILYVGRIEKKKGVLDLMYSCVQVLRSNSDVELLYIGDGQYLEKLVSVSKALGIENKVNFFGHLNHDRVIQIMLRCTILVIPTRKELGEGRPKTVIEGLIHGVPIIVPNYGIFRYLVTDGYNGIYYIADSIEDLNNKINYLLCNPSIRDRIGKNAKNDSDSIRNPPVTFSVALERSWDMSMKNTSTIY